MSTILNIETSGSICSVALSSDGALVWEKEDESGMNHSTALAPFVEEGLAEAARRELKLDAIAVSMGPGSYTGLRIGLSLAKGLAYARQLPLIGVKTLELMAVKMMFRPGIDWTGEEILVPMVDARRMEVYTGAYDFALNEKMKPGALILDTNSYSELLDNKERRVYFFGNGSEKARELLEAHPNARVVGDMAVHARDMMALAERALRNGEFLDTAYSVPLYLKEYQTSTPKKKI